MTKTFFAAFAMTLAFMFSVNLALAGNVAGCETVPAAGSNYTVKADPACVLPTTGETGGAFIVTDDGIALAGNPDVIVQ